MWLVRRLASPVSAESKVKSAWASFESKLDAARSVGALDSVAPSMEALVTCVVESVNDAMLVFTKHRCLDRLVGIGVSDDPPGMLACVLDAFKQFVEVLPLSDESVLVPLSSLVHAVHGLLRGIDAATRASQRWIFVQRNLVYLLHNTWSVLARDPHNMELVMSIMHVANGGAARPECVGGSGNKIPIYSALVPFIFSKGDVGKRARASAVLAVELSCENKDLENVMCGSGSGVTSFSARVARGIVRALAPVAKSASEAWPPSDASACLLLDRLRLARVSACAGIGVNNFVDGRCSSARRVPLDVAATFKTVVLEGCVMPLMLQKAENAAATGCRVASLVLSECDRGEICDVASQFVQSDAIREPLSSYVSSLSPELSTASLILLSSLLDAGIWQPCWNVRVCACLLVEWSCIVYRLCIVFECYGCFYTVRGSEAWRASNVLVVLSVCKVSPSAGRYRHLSPCTMACVCCVVLQPV